MFVFHYFSFLHLFKTSLIATGSAFDCGLSISSTGSKNKTFLPIQYLFERPSISPEPELSAFLNLYKAFIKFSWFTGYSFLPIFISSPKLFTYLNASLISLFLIFGFSFMNSPMFSPLIFAGIAAVRYVALPPLFCHIKSCYSFVNL